MTRNATVTLGVRDLSGRDLTGQAVMVTLRIPPDHPDHVPPVIVDRRDIDLASADAPARVYHAAQGLPLDGARALVEHASEAAERRARTGLEDLLTELRRAAHSVGTVALPTDEGPDVAGAPLADVLASHTLIHAAEAYLYRDALVSAAADQGITVFRYPIRSLAGVAAESLHLTPAAVTTQLDAWGREVGRPWRRHHKDAALAAWIAPV